MYTYGISFCITIAGTPYLHIDIIVCCIVLNSEIPSVTVSLILVLGSRFDGASVL